MKMNEKCLPCLINQVVKVAKMTHANNREELYKKVFLYLSTVDFDKTNPEIIGATFQMLKEHIHNNDPYQEIRKYYNDLFLDKLSDFEAKIDNSSYPFETAIKYAIIGNVIDFNPIHNQEMNSIMNYFDNIESLVLKINDIHHLVSDIKTSQTLLYLGDNCGEICLDKLLIKKIKELNPNLHIYFGVRGVPVVNDSIEEDAYYVGIQDYASIINNGDNSLGTIIERTSSEFKDIYHTVDFVVAKGQANYESLSEENKNIYFLLMSKCEVISTYLGVKEKSLICLKNKTK